MKICPSCGRENADDARFCSGCATALERETQREERKVVTCLFCDLVGFTARAERMDPEDVRRLLQPYHARVRGELERFGGTVEKFIGDAVMAVFGAPVAHEDDPERAVRAALSIRDVLAEEGELEVRIGITTGEALVALGARPEAGEGMASGDVVNTAARLQAARRRTASSSTRRPSARPSARSIRASRARSTQRARPSRSRPGRRCARARASRSSVSAERRSSAASGSSRCCARRSLASIREREPQLVTLVGVPGIGKSRLVFELFQTIESGEFGLVYWRHGRSLPYGEGVTFWALGEMVKAQAGILESDAREQAGREAAPGGRDDSSTTRPMPPGSSGTFARSPGSRPTRLGGDRRDEAFAAWRRYLEAIADERPLVLVFEDLHWADDALLDFVDYLVEWASGVPLLVLCTARPELLARRPGWGGGKVNSSTILLSPLSEEETAELLHALLGRSAIDAELQARLLEHAGGNPLYAEEFTRMLSEGPARSSCPRRCRASSPPASTRSRPRRRSCSRTRPCIGRVFWLGRARPRALDARGAAALARAQGVRTPQRRSSVAGEDEYAFRHALVRDVAYEQIPRAQRADKHRAAAEWIESLGRPEDHAEMLAHHYASALEYARAAGSRYVAAFEPAASRRRCCASRRPRALALHALRQASLTSTSGRSSSRRSRLRGSSSSTGGRSASRATNVRQHVLGDAAQRLLGAGEQRVGRGGARVPERGICILRARGGEAREAHRHGAGDSCAQRRHRSRRRAS